MFEYKKTIALRNPKCNTKFPKQNCSTQNSMKKIIPLNIIDTTP